MTTTTKRDKSGLIKNMGILLMILFMFIVTGCKDEPEEPMPFDCIPASILPGQWVLESFTPEDGPLEEINCPFTILDFEYRSKDTEIDVNNGIEFWLQGLLTFTNSECYDPNNRSDLGIGYLMLCKRQKAKLSTSKTYYFNIDINDENATGSYKIECDDLRYEDGVLTAKESRYCHALFDYFVKDREGIVRFRKIK